MRFFIYLILLVNISCYAHDYKFGAIEGLFEQEVAKVVLPKIYKEIGLDVSVTSGPANAIENKLALGFLDGEILRIHSYGEDNENVVRVPTPYYQLETMGFVRSGSGVSIKSLEDLKKYRVAVVKGVKHTENATKQHPKVVVLPKTSQILKLLSKGKVDVVLTNTVDGLVAIEKLKLKDVEPLAEPLATEPLYHYLYKTNAHLVPKVDKAIKDLSRSSALKMMLRKAELQIVKRHN